MLMELGCNVVFCSFFLNNNVIPGKYIAIQEETTENNVAKQFHVCNLVSRYIIVRVTN